MATRVEAEGSSIDEAIEGALSELGIPREQARVEILQDARKGLFGFGGRRARVLVSVRGSVFEQQTSSEPMAFAAAGPGASDAADVLQQILSRMGLEASVAADDATDDGQQSLRITTEASALLIGRHGQTLDALEYLVNRIVGKHEGRGAHVVIDCEGYRERHQQELRENALRLADNVRERGKSQTTLPMSPRDRRVVHLALDGAPGIVTRSVGQGYLRRVVIAPARGSKAAAAGNES